MGNAILATDMIALSIPYLYSTLDGFVESREDKAQNPFATNGRYNLFRPLTALLDLPKMPVFTANRRPKRTDF